MPAAAVAVVPLLYLVVRTGGAGPARVLDILTGPRTVELAARSVALATAVTAVPVLLGTIGVWLVVRSDLPWRRGRAVLLALPLAVVFLGMRLVPSPYQELPMLLLAYAVLFLPLAVGGVRTVVAASPPRLEEVSRSLGNSRSSMLRRVTLPLAAPGVGAPTSCEWVTRSVSRCTAPDGTSHPPRDDTDTTGVLTTDEIRLISLT